MSIKLTQGAEYISVHIDETEYKINIYHLSPERLILKVPFIKDIITFFLNNTHIEYNLLAKNMLFKCTSEIKGFKREKDRVLVTLDYPTVIYKANRRKYVRVEIPSSIDIYYMDASANDPKISKEPSLGKIIDISGGGIKFTSEYELKQGTDIIVCFYLPHKIKALSKIVRSEKDENANSYRISASFEKIDNPDREKIINFVFKELRTAELVKRPQQK